MNKLYLYGRITLVVLLALASQLAGANTIVRSVEVGDKNDPPVTAYNEGRAGLNWSKVMTKNLILHLLSTNGKGLKHSSVVDQSGVLWKPVSTVKCASQHTYQTVDFLPRESYPALFAGEFCVKGDGGNAPPPEWAAGVIYADIDADTDNDSDEFQRPCYTGPDNSGDEADQEDVAEQKSPGLLVCVNKGIEEGGTDREGNPISDYIEEGIIVSDPHLKRGLISLELPGEVEGEASITYDDTRLKVYVWQGNSYALIPSGEYFEVDSLNFEPATPSNKYGKFEQWGETNAILIEGIKASQEPGDQKILVTLKPDNGEPSLDDMIATVIESTADILSSGNYIVPGSSKNRIEYDLQNPPYEHCKIMTGKIEVFSSNDLNTPIRTLALTGSELKNGNHVVEWDGKTEEGDPLTEACSPYVYKLTVTDSCDCESTDIEENRKVKSWKFNFTIPDKEAYGGSGRSGIDDATVVIDKVSTIVILTGAAEVVIPHYEVSLVNDAGVPDQQGKNAKVKLKTGQDADDAYLFYTTPTTSGMDIISYDVIIESTAGGALDKAKNEWDMDKDVKGIQRIIIWRFKIDGSGNFRKKSDGSAGVDEKTDLHKA